MEFALNGRKFCPAGTIVAESRKIRINGQQAGNQYFAGIARPL
jgi:hypothetical protein